MALLIETHGPFDAVDLKEGHVFLNVYKLYFHIVFQNKKIKVFNLWTIVKVNSTLVDFIACLCIMYMQYIYCLIKIACSFHSLL